MNIRARTLARIESAHRHGAFYRGYLANHLPMALVALDAMGASDERIARFIARYEVQLEPLAPAAAPIEAGDEARHLGEPRAFSSWVDYFAARIDHEGAPSVLRAWATRLAEGIGSGAFHGAIRTAYAVESGSARELAHALAYWASAYEALPVVKLGAGIESPGQLLASIASNSEHAGRKLPGANIAQRTRFAASQAGFAALVARADTQALTLDAVATALIHAYGASGNFTILHGVTGCHAFRMLAPHFEDGPGAVARFWTAIVAAYLGCGSPPVHGWRLEGRDALDWPEIRRRAVECDDEHDVKLAYSCWREGLHYGGDAWRRVASAAVCAAQREAMPC